MKRSLLTLILCQLVLLLVACAGTQKPLDKKYIFEQFEQVDRIRTYQIDGWSSIDEQSLLVSDSPSKSYLIILKSRNYDLRHAQLIAFDTNQSTVLAGFDRIKIINRNSQSITIPAYIERIYKLTSKEQRKIAKAQIKGVPLKDESGENKSHGDESHEDKNNKEENPTSDN